MTDLLSIATFAVDQIPGGVHEFTDSMFVDFVLTTGGPIVQISPVTSTSTIIAEMRQANANALLANKATESLRDEDRAARKAQALRTGVWQNTSGERTTARLNSTQTAEKSALLKGLDDGMGNSWNAAKLVAGVAKRRNGQLKYARPGKAKPDMLNALMAYFQSPSWAMDELQCTPGPVPKATATDLLSDAYVVDVVEGLGFTVPQGAALTSLLKGINAVCGVNGRGNGRGRPRKVTTVIDREQVERGVGHLRCHYSDALPMGRIPGGNDVMQGEGAARRLRDA